MLVKLTPEHCPLSTTSHRKISIPASNVYFFQKVFLRNPLMKSGSCFLRQGLTTNFVREQHCIIICVYAARMWPADRMLPFPGSRPQIWWYSKSFCKIVAKKSKYVFILMANLFICQLNKGLLKSRTMEITVRVASENIIAVSNVIDVWHLV